MPELRPGSSRCWCQTCGHFFSGTTAFDKHRVGKHEPYERRCLGPDEMRAKGMVDNNGVWGKPGPVDAPWRTGDAVEEEA